MPKTSSPIALEWDEDGLHVVMDLDEMQGVVLTYENGKIHAVMHTGQAWDLYEHVHDTLADWHAEGMAAKRSVARGEGPNGEVSEDSGYDPLDPKHPHYAANIAELGDARRKRDRGE